MPINLSNACLQRASAITERMLSGGRSGRSRFFDTGKEIAQYAYAPDYHFEYQTLPAKAFFRAKVALTAEAMRVFGPYLYQVNPHRTFTVRDESKPEMGRIAEITSQYLNYTPEKLDLYHHERRTIDDGVSWGRGCMWTDVDPTTGLVGSEYFPVRDLLVDPEGGSRRTWRYICRRYRKNRAEAKRMYPQARWDQIGKDQRGKNDDTLPWEQREKLVGDLVTFWCIYAKRGLEGMKGFTDLQQAQRDEATSPSGNQQAQQGEPLDLSKPAVFVTTEDGKIIDIQPWSVPYYKEDEYPLTELDFYDTMDSPWPISPLDPAMGFQRAINWTVTLLMGRMRNDLRFVGATLDQGGEGLNDANMGKLMMGSDVEWLTIKVKGETRSLKDFYQEVTHDMGYMSAGINWLNLLESRFQKASGLYEILYSGNTDTQSRSATDAQMKDRNSQSRVKDMRDQIEKHATRVARKEAQALRFLKDTQHIGKVLGQQAAQDWGFLVKPGGDTVPALAQQLNQQFVQAGAPPEQAQQMAMQMAQEKVKQAVDFDRWMLETDYGIEADSIRRRDIDLQIDSLKELHNQLVPLQLQNPNPMIQALGYDTTATYLKAIGSDRRVIANYEAMAASLRQPPPPMPMAPGAPAPQQPATEPAGA